MKIFNQNFVFAAFRKDKERQLEGQLLELSQLPNLAEWLDDFDKEGLSVWDEELDTKEDIKKLLIRGASNGFSDSGEAQSMPSKKGVNEKKVKVDSGDSRKNFKQPQKPVKQSCNEKGSLISEDMKDNTSSKLQRKKTKEEKMEIIRAGALIEKLMMEKTPSKNSNHSGLNSHIKKSPGEKLGEENSSDNDEDFEEVESWKSRVERKSPTQKSLFNTALSTTNRSNPRFSTKRRHSDISVSSASYAENNKRKSQPKRPSQESISVKQSLFGDDSDSDECEPVSQHMESPNKLKPGSPLKLKNSKIAYNAVPPPPTSENKAGNENSVADPRQALGRTIHGKAKVGRVFDRNVVSSTNALGRSRSNQRAVGRNQLVKLGSAGNSADKKVDVKGITMLMKESMKEKQMLLSTPKPNDSTPCKNSEALVSKSIAGAKGKDPSICRKRFSTLSESSDSDSDSETVAKGKSLPAKLDKVEGIVSGYKEKCDDLEAQEKKISQCTTSEKTSSKSLTRAFSPRKEKLMMGDLAISSDSDDDYDDVHEPVFSSSLGANPSGPPVDKSENGSSLKPGSSIFDSDDEDSAPLVKKSVEHSIMDISVSSNAEASKLSCDLRLSVSQCDAPTLNSSKDDNLDSNSLNNNKDEDDSKKFDSTSEPQAIVSPKEKSIENVPISKRIRRNTSTYSAAHRPHTRVTRSRSSSISVSTPKKEAPTKPKSETKSNAVVPKRPYALRRSSKSDISSSLPFESPGVDSLNKSEFTETKPDVSEPLRIRTIFEKLETDSPKLENFETFFEQAIGSPNVKSVVPTSQHHPSKDALKEDSDSVSQKSQEKSDPCEVKSPRIITRKTARKLLSNKSSAKIASSAESPVSRSLDTCASEFSKSEERKKPVCETPENRESRHPSEEPVHGKNDNQRPSEKPIYENTDLVQISKETRATVPLKKYISQSSNRTTTGTARKTMESDQHHDPTRRVTRRRRQIGMFANPKNIASSGAEVTKREDNEREPLEIENSIKKENEEKPDEDNNLSEFENEGKTCKAKETVLEKTSQNCESQEKSENAEDSQGNLDFSYEDEKVKPSTTEEIDACPLLIAETKVVEKDEKLNLSNSAPDDQKSANEEGDFSQSCESTTTQSSTSKTEVLAESSCNALTKLSTEAIPKEDNGKDKLTTASDLFGDYSDPSSDEEDGKSNIVSSSTSAKRASQNNKKGSILDDIIGLNSSCKTSSNISISCLRSSGVGKTLNVAQLKELERRKLKNRPSFCGFSKKDPSPIKQKRLSGEPVSKKPRTNTKLSTLKKFCNRKLSRGNAVPRALRRIVANQSSGVESSDESTEEGEVAAVTRTPGKGRMVIESDSETEEETSGKLPIGAGKPKPLDTTRPSVKNLELMPAKKSSTRAKPIAAGGGKMKKDINTIIASLGKKYSPSKKSAILLDNTFPVQSFENHKKSSVHSVLDTPIAAYKPSETHQSEAPQGEAHQTPCAPPCTSSESSAMTLQTCPASSEALKSLQLPAEMAHEKEPSVSKALSSQSSQESSVSKALSSQSSQEPSVSKALSSQSSQEPQLSSQSSQEPQQSSPIKDSHSISAVDEPDTCHLTLSLLESDSDEEGNLVMNVIAVDDATDDCSDEPVSKNISPVKRKSTSPLSSSVTKKLKADDGKTKPSASASSGVPGVASQAFSYFGRDCLFGKESEEAEEITPFWAQSDDKKSDSEEEPFSTTSLDRPTLDLDELSPEQTKRLADSYDSLVEIMKDVSAVKPGSKDFKVAVRKVLKLVRDNFQNDAKSSHGSLLQPLCKAFIRFIVECEPIADVEAAASGKVGLSAPLYCLFMFMKVLEKNLTAKLSLESSLLEDLLSEHCYQLVQKSGVFETTNPTAGRLLSTNSLACLSAWYVSSCTNSTLSS